MHRRLSQPDGQVRWPMRTRGRAERRCNPSSQFAVDRRGRPDRARHGALRASRPEFRPLADLAITAQEHTDLKLGDVSAQLDYLREQNESLQRILKEVE
ncbi:MAG TPA: hypothetical protein VLX31_00905 [Streptosporangiaceae bacterium]|nr:hypothetical protein [Streptosporangiaceae bacterium]